MASSVRPDRQLLHRVLLLYRFAYRPVLTMLGCDANKSLWVGNEERIKAELPAQKPSARK